jgi:chloramphenicol-sensitive protein RarD
MNKGAWYAVGAYTIWGLLPVYWKWLQAVPAPQVLGHRILWSFLSLIALIWLSRQGKSFRAAVVQPQILRLYTIAAVLLGINWLTYVWAVNAGFIVETSLGYFINPLLNVALGVVFLRERLRSWQWLAIALAAAGVLYLTFVYGSFPWIALTLAVTFGLYGMVKKTAPLGSLHGLTLETAVLFLPALAYLSFSEVIGQGSFLHTGALGSLLLMGAGPVTSIPLLMFASAAQRIPLSLVGIFQYIAPTLQFLLGVLVYGEAFSTTRLIGFGLVWVGLIIFVLERILAYRGQSASEGG